MTAKIRLLPSAHEFPAEPHETLLEAALRAGLAPSYSCSNGSCGQCRARLVSGQLCQTRFHDFVISETDKAAGSFLMCSACADGDVVVEASEAEGVGDIPHQNITTRVNKIERLSDDLLVLHLRTPRNQTLRFLAGQHVSVEIPGLAPRNKSIASCPCNAMHLQFHIHRVPGDPFADYLFDQLRVNQSVALSGPHGSFTLDEQSGRPLILLAYETGFAPIKSLIEHAIALEFALSMRLYWVVRRAGGHYLENYCRSWSDALDDFSYTPLAGDGSDATSAEQDFLRGGERIVRDCPDLSGYDVYVNGPEPLMGQTRELLLAHGLPEQRLFIDYLQRF